MHAYDLVRYRSVALPQTHPDRMATHARLFGLDPAPVKACRVLEVGCGDGANVLPMAMALPESTFVGIDIAPTPIAAGRERAAAWGVTNLDLHALDLTEAGDLGTFDYISAHGVYSWVPDAVRDGLMDLFARCLAPQGVAFVSYNALPGGHLRRLTREMMQFHIAGIDDPARRMTQARAVLDFVLDAQPPDTTYRAVLEDERDRCHRYTDEHLFHDHLAETNRPFYFHEVAAHAERHGLRYLAEADFAAMQDRAFPPETRAALRQLEGDPIRREQMLDFLRNRMFRQTLLCRADADARWTPDPERVRALTVAAPIRAVAEAGEVVTFEGANGKSIRTGHPFAQAVCRAVGEAWPQAVSFGTLHEVVTDDGEDGALLAEMLLDFYGDGFVALHTYAPALASEPSAQPEALASARREAGEGEVVTDGWHRTLPLDEQERRLLALLDGTHDRAALLAALAAADRSVTEKEIDYTLSRFADAALLVEGGRG
jgi:methyltransferase-like protein/ubiquinone/menaquinone biosynthesis C-methylase UbiE